MDPSQIHRPEPVFDEYNAFHNFKPSEECIENIGKEKEKFRDYDVDESMAHVRETYKDMHIEQTVAKGKELVCKNQ